MQFILITCDTGIAELAEAADVDRVMVDLEIIGKVERQGVGKTVISRHSMNDVTAIRNVISRSELQVRVNPPGPHTAAEINEVIDRGADRLMLPMFVNASEVGEFVRQVDGRANVTLLLETPQALTRIREILAVDGIDEIHIGLNDLHLGLGLDFMFELLASPLLEDACRTIAERNVRLGIGGVARLGSGDIPAELVLPRLWKCGAAVTILSRSFTSHLLSAELEGQSDRFIDEVGRIRSFWADLASWSEETHDQARTEFESRLRQVVDRVRSS